VKLNRSEFLKLMTAVAGGACIPDAFADPYGIPPGIQLYTVRNDLKSNFAGTLQKISAMGYRELEVGVTPSGNIDFNGGTPQEFRKMIDDLGLRVPSCHFGPPKDDAEWARNIDRAQQLKLQYMVCAVPPKGTDSPDAWKRAADYFNHLGLLCRNAGVQLAYHNHNHEFRVHGGVVGYDELLRLSDPRLVKMELDCFWMTFAGHDPVEYMHKYPGRFPLLHIKDLKSGYKPTTDDFKGNPFAEVGSGVIDWKRIFEAAKGGGLKYYFVEQDMWDRPSLESAAMSAAYLKKLQV
jgi:sugar phosphate isomerase/epimerase